MGTRADFYVGNGLEAEWLGSIAWDGYREGIDEKVFQCTTEDDYRAAVNAFLQSRDDATFPSMGWPWPWNTSATSDCSYWFFDGKVFDDYASHYVPCDMQMPSEDEHPDEYYEFIKNCKPLKDYPDMSGKKNLALGNRSGLIVISR